MNHEQRIRAAIRFRETDRPPVVPELIAVTATMAGVSPKEYLTSGGLIAELQLEAQKKIGHDVVFASADLCVEAEAAGCEITMPEDNYPSIKRPVMADLSEIEKLKVPDPHSGGRMPEVLKAVRRLKAEVRGRIPVIATVTGPMTIASRVMDIEKMLYALVDHPDRFRGLLDVCREVTLSYAAELAREGADGVLIFDPSSSPFVIPARIFREFSLGAVKSVTSRLKEIDPEIITWYSVAGPLQKNTSILSAVGADITTADYVVPIETALRYSASTAINGNIRPSLFLDGPREKIIAESEKLLAAARATERFILGSGCEVPLYSKAENIAALVEAAEREAERFEAAGNTAGLRDAEITVLPHRKKISAVPGESLLDSLHKANISVTSYCDRSGSCGKCAVMIKNGETGQPDRAEAFQLQARGADPKERLACRVKVGGPMSVYVPYHSRIFQSHMTASGELFEKSISKELAPFGFEPNVGVEEAPLPSLAGPAPSSWEEWVTGRLGLNGMSPQVAGRLASMINESDGGVRAVIDRQRGEIVDFTRSDKVYGLAVDIGTTTISAYAHDLKTGELACVGSTENPQTRWGMDVVTRTTRVVEDPSLLPVAQANLIEGVNRLIAHFHRDHALPNDRIYDMTVVGNPVIIHMLLGISPESLARAPFTPTVSRWVSATARGLHAKNRLAVHPECRVEILPSAGGFVGADAVAGALAAGVSREEELSLFVDIGTNGEIILGSRDGLLCASVAAGPAFEGAHLSHGRVSQAGAIKRIRLTAPGRVEFETIGGAAPFGLCGSAVIDALAEFSRHGIIDERGKFAANGDWPQLKGDFFILAPKQKTATFNPIGITRGDIEEIQKAKSALRTGISLLMKEMGAAPEDIKKVTVSGSFGFSLDIGNAKAIGMIPALPRAEFRYIKNAAGIGARMALLSKNAREEAGRIAGITRSVSLVDHGDFMNLFIDNMLFPAA
ncbi:MAG: ASKHA domain-containing protein [Candidatus Nitrospinota bacterium M3_3B_026]